MANEIYQVTEWKDYPNTTTLINAAKLNSLENRSIMAAKLTATFMLSAVFGGFKKEIYSLNDATTRGITISKSDYQPENGDKLAVWKLGAVPCTENVDYTLIESTDSYLLKAATGITDMINVYVQIWNIPVSTGSGIVGAAYPSISSMSTDSVSGLVEE